VRQPNPADRRSQWLALSDAGRSLYEMVVPQALAMEAAIFADFAPAEVAALGALLDRIDAAALALPGQDRRE
jgi:DNA-binding MarR family transcriptional regulator